MRTVASWLWENAPLTVRRLHLQGDLVTVLREKANALTCIQGKMIANGLYPEEAIELAMEIVLKGTCSTERASQRERLAAERIMDKTLLRMENLPPTYPTPERILSSTSPRQSFPPEEKLPGTSQT
jgi:hypothetical protein